MKNKILVLLLLVTLVINACAAIVAPTEESVEPAIDELISIPTEPEPAPQPELPVVSSWKAVRDPRYGFGLAVPCWWLVTPVPAEGFGGVMTLRNYDEAYFNANSNKGFWEWPNGSLKIDMVIMEGVDPDKSDIDGYLQFSDPTMESLVSVESQQFGSRTATMGTFANLNNTNDPNISLFFFRLAPDKLLMINPIPQSIITTPDFQALLASIVLSPEEQISLPLITPAPALINAPCAS